MKFDKVYVGIIVVLILVIGYLVMQAPIMGNQQTASSTIKQIYDLQFETNSEVLAVNDTNGIYKMVVRFNDPTGKSTTQDIFVTKDGKLFTNTLVSSDSYLSFLNTEKNFAECLQIKGVRILGQANDTATLQQIQALGTYAYKIFVSCDGTNEAACQQIGITKYPTTVYNNTAYTELYTPAFYSQLTNCTIGA
ncbi:MAG TPA: hypothetical protein VJB05_03105 [archaeon]|nr:hypothetical protein [archaeon]